MERMLDVFEESLAILTFLEQRGLFLVASVPATILWLC